MIGKFMGKYAFQSITGTSKDWYVTYYIDDGSTILKMSANTITDNEKFSVYSSGDMSKCVICLFNRQFITEDKSIGWLMASSNMEDALDVYFSYSDYNILSWNMYNDEAGKFGIMRYTVNNPNPFLLFPAFREECTEDVGENETAYFQMNNIQITPGIDEIRKAGGVLNGDFKRVDLTGADLSGLDLTGCDFEEAILLNVDFSKSVLKNSNFKDAILTGTDFEGSDLSGSDFSGNDLSDAKWGKGVVASNSCFKGCSACKVDMEGAVLNQADFTGADFDNAGLKGAYMQKAVMQDSNFSGAVLEEADLSGIIGGKTADLPGVNLSFAYMPDVKLTDAHLNGANLSHVQLYGSDAKADNAVMEEADLSFSNLTGMDLSQAHLQGAILDEAILVNCNMIGVELIPSGDGQAVSFTKANLQGANFKDAVFEKVNMSNSAVALDEGVPLFTILSPDYINDLNKGTVPQELIDDFTENGYELSGDVEITVIKKDSEWNLTQDIPLEELGLGYSTFLLKYVSGDIKVFGTVMTINRLSEDNELEKYLQAVAPTNISNGLLDDSTVCPNQATYSTNIKNKIEWEDMMTAAAPPHPPECIPDPYHWCPKCTCTQENDSLE